MATVELSKAPGTRAVFVRAATRLVPGRAGRGDTLPDVDLVLRGVTVDRRKLADYNRVCGFRLTDTLPATYPHILAFPVAMQLMTAPEFPIPLVGLVHLANRITVHRPIDTGESLDLSVRAAHLRPHDRGRQVDVVATASVGDEVVWQGTSTYLSKERAAPGGDRRGTGERPTPPAASAQWRVEPRVGRDYARVSGDHNPIHTSRLGARLFGFRRPIAHGMWSMARCLAALEGRLPEAYTVDVAFKLPLPLASTVAFSATPGDGTPAWTFALHNARSDKPHLAGSVR